MSRIILNPSRARAIILDAAGLSKKRSFGKGKEAVFKLIDHLGFVQIDSNYVVERAHHHIVASRVTPYDPVWIDELQEEGRIFEFWSYAAGYLPMKEFRFSLPLKEAFVKRRKPLTPSDVSWMNKVYNTIAREGPQMAKDFEYDRVKKSTGWWDWRPSKLALERLHFEGKLVTAARKDFQKVYDLPDNVVPSDVDRTPPTMEEFTRHVILRLLGALGVASFKDLHFSSRYTNIPLKEMLQRMTASGEIAEAELSGLKGSSFYMLPSYRTKKITLSEEVRILSPFDILNVFRTRLKIFFDFDYQIECFVPAPKRKYGYFSLPILLGDTFIARMDSKADRKAKTLIIHNLHFEKVKLGIPAIEKLADAIQSYASFNQCERVRISKCNDRKVMKVIGDLIEE